MGIKIIKIATYLHDGVLLIKLLVKSFLIKKTLLNISKIGNNNITYLNVLGNGPSLKKDLEWIRSNRGQLTGEYFIGVNFFALSEEYIETKPFIYVLADPLFWRNDLVDKLDEKRDRLIDILKTTFWEMNIFLPEQARNSKLIEKVKTNQNINVYLLPNNYAPLLNESLYEILVRKRIMTPLYGNVLLVSLWIAYIIGIKEIRIYGANFDFYKSYRVDQKTNEVFVETLHFYENKPTREENKYTGQKNKMLHVRLRQASSALFNAYILSKVFKKSGRKVINLSSNSVIDSFERS